MFRADVVKVWVLGVLVFFTTQALEPLLDSGAQAMMAALAIAVYLIVALYTFDPKLPTRKPKDERPSAVRARLEAAQRRKGQG
ncbi:MAG: hypothetical protein JWR85_4076 [Marmoricola sp.]|nr:hypothetical protein [Marmoricola sp.]